MQVACEQAFFGTFREPDRGLQYKWQKIQSENSIQMNSESRNEILSTLAFFDVIPY